MRNWNGFVGKPRSMGSPFAAQGRKEAEDDDEFLRERERMIAEAAYFQAEKRGFAPADATADWLRAEAEVEYLVHSRH